MLRIVRVVFVIGFIGLVVSSYALANPGQSIPKNCDIQTSSWSPDSPQQKFPGTYHVENGRVTSTFDFTGDGPEGKKIHYAGEFVGRLEGNTIIGTTKQTMDKWTRTYPGSLDKPCTCTRWGSWTVEYKTVFNEDGTLSGSGTTTGTLYSDFQGAGCSQQGQVATPQKSTEQFLGTWLVGNEPPVVMKGK